MMWHSTGRVPKTLHQDRPATGRGGKIASFLTDGGVTFRHNETGHTETFEAKAGTCVFFPHDILELGCPYSRAKVGEGSHVQTRRRGPEHKFDW